MITQVAPIFYLHSELETGDFKSLVTKSLMDNAYS